MCLSFKARSFLVLLPSKVSDAHDRWLVGFPGIAPSLPHRSQAAVKGVCFVIVLRRNVWMRSCLQTVELRIGSQGVKAKWLRIELRKIEILPGGGATNTYFDFVGQSPISLWQATNDWNPIFTVIYSTQNMMFIADILIIVARFSFLHSHSGDCSSFYYIGEKRSAALWCSLSRIDQKFQ